MTFPVGRLRASELNDQINRREGTTTRVANSSAFTAETVLDSITVALTSGRVYKVMYYGSINSSVQDGYVRCRIREDNISGTQLQLAQVPTAAIAATQNLPLIMEALFTAASTADKTFVVTAVRQAGTGNITAIASSGNPTYLYVDHISG